MTNHSFSVTSNSIQRHWSWSESYYINPEACWSENQAKTVLGEFWWTNQYKLKIDPDLVQKHWCILISVIILTLDYLKLEFNVILVVHRTWYSMTKVIPCPVTTNLSNFWWFPSVPQCKRGKVMKLESIKWHSWPNGTGKKVLGAGCAPLRV